MGQFILFIGTDINEFLAPRGRFQTKQVGFGTLTQANGRSTVGTKGIAAKRITQLLHCKTYGGPVIKIEQFVFLECKGGLMIVRNR